MNVSGGCYKYAKAGDYQTSNMSPLLFQSLMRTILLSYLKGSNTYFEHTASLFSNYVYTYFCTFILRHSLTLVQHYPFCLLVYWQTKTQWNHMVAFVLCYAFLRFLKKHISSSFEAFMIFLLSRVITKVQEIHVASTTG